MVGKTMWCIHHTGAVHGRRQSTPENKNGTIPATQSSETLWPALWLVLHSCTLRWHQHCHIVAVWTRKTATMFSDILTLGPVLKKNTVSGTQNAVGVWMDGRKSKKKLFDLTTLPCGRSLNVLVGMMTSTKLAADMTTAMYLCCSPSHTFAHFTASILTSVQSFVWMF